MDLCQKGNELPGSPNKLSVQFINAIHVIIEPKQTGSNELLSKYKHLRNKVVHMVKRNYLNNLKSASCKDFWKAVKILNLYLLSALVVVLKYSTQ